MDVQASIPSVSSTSSTSLTLIFSLEKKAKNAGGDKYVCDSQPEFNIYIPQNLSRKGGTPAAKLEITIK